MEAIALACSLSGLRLVGALYRSGLRPEVVNLRRMTDQDTVLVRLLRSLSRYSRREGRSRLLTSRLLTFFFGDFIPAHCVSGLMKFEWGRWAARVRVLALILAAACWRCLGSHLVG